MIPCHLKQNFPYRWCRENLLKTPDPAQCIVFSSFIIITISAKGSTEAPADSSIETCQNAYIPKIGVNRLMKERYPKIEVQNSLPLNPDLSMLTENPEESTSNVIVYHHTFGFNM
jgi:hypothetical protein